MFNILICIVVKLFHFVSLVLVMSVLCFLSTFMVNKDVY